MRISDWSSDVCSSDLAAAKRRRRRWTSPAAYAESLGKRFPYSRFRPDMLEAHCRATLRPTAAGDYELCCAPEVEMATYEAVDNFTTFAALPAFPCPVDRKSTRLNSSH